MTSIVNPSPATVLARIPLGARIVEVVQYVPTKKKGEAKPSDSAIVEACQARGMTRAQMLAAGGAIGRAAKNHTVSEEWAKIPHAIAFQGAPSASQLDMILAHVGGISAVNRASVRELVAEDDGEGGIVVGTGRSGFLALIETIKKRKQTTKTGEASKAAILLETLQGFQVEAAKLREEAAKLRQIESDKKAALLEAQALEA